MNYWTQVRVKKDISKVNTHTNYQQVMPKEIRLYIPPLLVNISVNSKRIQVNSPNAPNLQVA